MGGATGLIVHDRDGAATTRLIRRPVATTQPGRVDWMIVHGPQGGSATCWRGSRIVAHLQARTRPGLYLRVAAAILRRTGQTRPR